MKLLTHNMLTSNIVKGVTKGYPLAIEVCASERQDMKHDHDAMIDGIWIFKSLGMLNNVDWMNKSLILCHVDQVFIVVFWCYKYNHDEMIVYCKKYVH